MLIDLPVVWIAVLNAGLWPLIQIGLAWGFLRMPAEWFRAPRSIGNARFYERYLGIKRWKDLLPDGASWFAGGFAKSRLGAAEPKHLERFVTETWRGELCHYCAFLFVPVFFLWNPWWGNLIIIVYALLANGPCILAQRYNRIRLLKLLQRHQAFAR